MTQQLWLWIGFNVFVLAMLALDLGVFHRKSHVVAMKEFLTWSGVCIIGQKMGSDRVMESWNNQIGSIA